MQLAKRVWDFITRNDLLHDGDAVVIGVSGGPDSLSLLDLLSRLATQHRWVLHVAHLNHGLRPEAGAEAALVQAEAARRGLTCFSETAEVAAAAANDKQSIETTARRLRYDFLRRVARQTGANRVAVAHTADDQAETVLMHLLRGSGLRGLRGMLPKRVMGELVIGHPGAAVGTQLPIATYQLPLFLIRPLLGTTRSDVMAYCAAQGLTPSIDSSNADPRYLRNRLRHELLPVLETYNPNVRAVLARTATVAAGDYEVWLGAVQDLWAATLATAAAEVGQVAFDRARWQALTLPKQRALLRLTVEQMTGNMDGIDFVPIESAVQFSHNAEPGRSCELVGGLFLSVTAEQIVVSDLEDAPRMRDGPRLVAGGLESGWRLRIEPLPEVWNLAQIKSAPRWTAHVDSDRLARPVQLRARRPGDRFQPLGLGGHSMLLSDFLVNEKVPAGQRDDWPLLVCGDEIVWVVGLRLDERYKVTKNTARVSRLSVRSNADT